MDKIWNDFPGCECLKLILINSGYDNLASLNCINCDSLTKLEDDIEKNRQIVENLTCDHKNIYLERDTFQFLPGHRALLIEWCKNQLKDHQDDLFNKNHPAFSTILSEIIGSALNNYNKSANSHRYSEVLVDFSIYLYIMAGKACYETLSLNLPIPKAGTILNRIHAKKERIVEGQLRCEQLSRYLEITNSPKSVFLSEDGSGVIKKIVYDSHSNQLIGLVLPTSEKNGMPIICSFKADSAELIKKHMEEPLSTLIYIVVAQPLNEKTAPFILQMYGTDNTFKATSVLKRWIHTENELKKYGIEVIGIASDGDNRLLSAMRTRMKFDLIPDIDIIKRFDAQSICVQDIIHIGTKFRNRLLNGSIILYIGNKIVSTVHIKYLIDTVAKDVHGLVQSDIFPEDRQNYKSLEKLMEDRVLNAMKKYVPDSEATVIYLTICKHITSSYLQPNLTPSERVYHIWYALYFLRCWRKWILSQKDYSLKNNFISNNAYTCVEINAHALIEMIVKLRTMDQARLFKPSLFSSQPCEHMFRTMRSMGTFNFTKINFNLNELFHMIARLEMTNKIVYSNMEIKFARFAPDNHDKKEHSLQLPSDEQIMNEMENARTNALANAAELGILLTADDITQNTEFQRSRERKAEATMEMFSFECDSEEEFLDFGTTDSQSNSDLTIELVDSDGTVKRVRKSTFLWMHSESKERLSTDRLKRVRESTESNLTRKKLKPNDIFSDGANVLKLNELKIGDWALFNLNKKILPTSFNAYEQNGHFIANVIGFQYIDKQNRPKQYKLGHVLINQMDQETRKRDKKNIEVLAIWYICQENKILKHCNSKFTVAMENYTGTIKPPLAKLDSNIVNFVPSFVLQFEYTELENFVREQQQ